MTLPAASLRKATIETVAIDPKPGGKVEVTFRVVADQRGLIDCASAFIQAGVTGLEILDVFSVLLPPDIDLGLEPANVSPNVVPFDSVRSVSGPASVNGCDFSQMNAPLTAVNRNAMTEASDASHLSPFHDVASRLSNVEELLTTVYRMLSDHDHFARNGIQTLTYGMERLKKAGKPIAAIAAGLLCGHHHDIVVTYVHALLSLPGA
jgi:hypothetical protein